MAFVVLTGPCLDYLHPLVTDVLDEIVKSYHNQCPLVDFALSILLSTWRCRALLFPECLARGPLLIHVYSYAVIFKQVN